MNNYDEDIKMHLMKILYGTPNVTYNQYALYDKLVKNYYNDAHLPDDFKYRFMYILNKLPISENDIDVVITNGKYQISFVNDKNNQENKVAFEKSIDGLSQIDFQNTLFVNDPEEFFNWKCPITGNTIYHEIILHNNVDMLEKLIKINSFECNVTNNADLLPIELSANPKINKSIVIYMTLQLKTADDRIKQLNEHLNNSNKMIEKIDKQLDKVATECCAFIYLIFVLCIAVIFNKP